MAIGGQRPKPAALKLVTGNPGKREIPERAEIHIRETALLPSKKLTKAQQKLWDRFIQPAWWLEDPDVPKACMWVALQSEFDKAPGKMLSARISNLRALGSELCLDPTARARLGLSSAKRKDADEFFDD